MALRTLTGKLLPLVPPSPATRLVGVEYHLAACLISMRALEAVVEDLAFGVIEATQTERDMLHIVADAISNEVVALELVQRELTPIRKELMR